MWNNSHFLLDKSAEIKQYPDTPYSESAAADQNTVTDIQWIGGQN
jgi:hypothetical protein